LHDALALDATFVVHRRAVVQNGGRLLRFVPEVDLDRVALRRSNLRSILAERETLLVVRRDDALEVLPRDRLAVRRETLQDLLHVRVPLGVQRDVERTRVVSQREREESSGLVVSVCHWNGVGDGDRTRSTLAWKASAL